MYLVALFAAVTMAAAGCGDGAQPQPEPRALVASGSYVVGAEDAAGGEAPLRFTVEPTLEQVTLADERRPAIVLGADRSSGLAAGSWSWRVHVPKGARLQVGVGLVGEGPARVEGTVSVRSGSDREVVAVLRPSSGEKESGWADEGADLSRWAGQEVTLEMAVNTTTGRGSASPARVAWAPAALSSPRPAPELRETGRPNILVIVVDTLRFDHLAAYGYERETSPEIDRHLVERGAVFEDAYSQAPWTLPSVASYMTSRYPGEFLGGESATYGIPDSLPLLAEVLAGLEYRTAGFSANPTLQRSNGFGRGFETFYTPGSLEAIHAHADELNRRALPWIHAHRDQPFFLYVHYIDPHDPYMNPDVVDGRSPYFDDPGGISGRWVDGLYAGKIPVEDIDRQVHHLTALYDTEIRYVDRAIGELLATIPPEILAETLVVLTSDHGEELYDHGGWKHGHTLYEDQIHVPLLVRWDGRIRPGERLPGTVRLVDLAPTLVAAAGGALPAAWQGISLLGALSGEEPVPRLAAFAQHLSSGPMRVASVLEGQKLIRFNRRAPFEPEDELQAHLYALDMGRLERTELYDLETDPGERRDLAARRPAGEEGGPAGAGPPGIRPLDTVLRHHLHPVLEGLRAWSEALPPGSRLTGTLRFEREPEAPEPLFLGPDDRVAVVGARVEFEIVGEAVAKGFLVPGDPGALIAAELALDGEPLPPGRLRYGGGTLFTGAAVEPSALGAETAPAAADRPGLVLGRFGGTRPDTGRANPETRKSLKALGYIQ